MPKSALLLKGCYVFEAGTALTSGKILFGGERNLGAEQRASSSVVTWDPSITDHESVLKKIRRAPLKPNERTYPRVKQLRASSDLTQLSLKQMSSRLSSGETPGAATSGQAGKATLR